MLTQNERINLIQDENSTSCPPPVNASHGKEWLLNNLHPQTPQEDLESLDQEEAGSTVISVVECIPSPETGAFLFLNISIMHTKNFLLGLPQKLQDPAYPSILQNDVE
jgi:hypothetical protein